MSNFKKGMWNMVLDNFTHSLPEDQESSPYCLLPHISSYAFARITLWGKVKVGSMTIHAIT